MRHRTWSWAALCACLLAAAALAHASNAADDALQPNFLPSSAAKNSLGGVFVEEQATVHAEEGSAAKLLAEIEAQSAAADAAAAAAPAQPQDDGPPALSRADAESLTHTLMAALRGADPSQAFHEMMAERSTEDEAPVAVAAAAPVAEPQETPAFLQQKETATAARMATMVGNKRFEVEDKAEDLSKDPAEDKEEEEEEHPDPYQLHHAQDAAPAAAAAAPAGWPFMAAPMMQQSIDASAAAERFRQMSMMSNPYAALYQAYLQQFSQAGHRHKHRHHHRKADEDEPADKPASPAAAGAGAASSSSSSSDAMRFKEKESAKASDDDDEEDDDEDAGDADDDGDTDGEDDDDDDDGEERRRRERKRKQQQEKLKYDDAMNKMRFEQTQVNLDIENMKSFTSPRQSGYSAPVDATPVAAPASPAAIPLNPAAGGGGFRQLFNAPAAPSFTAPYPQAAPTGASAYPSLIALSSTTQQVPAASAVNANPNGVPMPFFPPTSAPPPAPNQVPVAAQTVNGVYPPSMVMPSTAAMPFAADGLTQSPAVNPSAPTMNPNAPAAPGLSNYPFGGTNFLELESQPLPAIHAHVDAIARHPRHPHVRSRLTEQHFEPFPLL